jgi:tetratricopeptide (TPR) repeat protein
LRSKRSAPSPEDASRHFEAGEALEDKKDWDGAIAEYREALRLDPSLELAHYNIGQVLEDKGEVDGAVAEYRELLRLNPDSVWTHEHIADMLRDKGDREGAVAEYRAALRLNPGYEHARSSLKKMLRKKDEPSCPDGAGQASSASGEAGLSIDITMPGFKCERLRSSCGSLRKLRRDYRDYGLAERYGFQNAEEAWAANPLLVRSDDSPEYRRAEVSEEEAAKVEEAFSEAWGRAEAKKMGKCPPLFVPEVTCDGPDSNVEYLPDGNADVWSLTLPQFDMYKRWYSWVDGARVKPSYLTARDRRAYESILEREAEEDKEIEEMEEEDKEMLSRPDNAALAQEYLAHPDQESGRKAYVKMLERERRRKQTPWENAKESFWDIALFPITAILSIRYPKLFRTTYPKSAAGFRRMGNGAMLAVLVSLAAISPFYLLTGSDLFRTLSLALLLPTILVMATYAPWYTLLTMIPAAILYGATAPPGDHGDRIFVWFWAWSLYALGRGIYHVVKWEKESQRGVPHHKVMKHPWLFAGTAVGIIAGARYAGKIGKKKD